MSCALQVWVSNCIGCGDESNLTVVAVGDLRADLILFKQFETAMQLEVS